MHDMMNSMHSGAPQLGAWCNLPSPDVAEIAARQGFDFVCVDFQHGLTPAGSAVEMFRAVDAGGSIPIARAAWKTADHLGRLLDLGCAGVIVPMIEGVEDARHAVEACLYPPMGARSFGPSRACWTHEKGDYREIANDRVMVFPMIETLGALNAVEEIAALPGVGGVFVGPSDLGISMGLGPGQDHDSDKFDDAIRRVLAAATSAGVIAGIQANPQLAGKRLAEGFRFVTISMDNVDLAQRFATDLASVRDGLEV